jgi:hypothetical protein
MGSQPTQIPGLDEYYALAPMTSNTPSPRATTPPKGRPTRSRNAYYGRQKVFGSTAQWIALVILLVLAFAIVLMAVY